MAISINTSLRNRLADSLADAFDAAAGNAVLRIYDGSAPADANAALGAQNLLAEVSIAEPAFGAAASGTVTKNGTWQDLSVDASGTAAWFRLQDGDGTYVLQGTVTATGGGGDMELSTVAFIAGGTFTVNSFNITQPAS